MSEPTWTPEPWGIGQSMLGGPQVYGNVPTEDGPALSVAVAYVHDTNPDHVANARRIVACVNACAGIPTEELEESPVPGFVKRCLDAVVAAKHRAEARAEAAEQECARLREAIEGMVWQFAHRTVSGKKRYLSAGGLSALEEAWDALGWGNQPRHVKELGCERDGCEQWVEAGLTDDDGSYVRLCSDHAVELMRRQKPEKAEA